MKDQSHHGKFKPLFLETKFGIVGYVVFIGALIGVFLKWTDFKDFFLPNNNIYNLKFFILSFMLVAVTVWFIYNHLWRQEYHRHERTIMDRDNLLAELKISENERLTDVVTGVPNSSSLMKDIEDRYSRMAGKKLQFILIDLKGFRLINKNYGQTRTNHLLRFISQTIYKSMRRNEDMYKFHDGKKQESETNGDAFYRVYPGGDEFAFIIEGDQAEALGFANRLVKQFADMSARTAPILGEAITLSFHCAIVEMDARDSYADIFRKAEDCYQVAKEGTRAFSICWHPINIEDRLSGDPQKKKFYEDTRRHFEVLTLEEV